MRLHGKNKTSWDKDLSYCTMSLNSAVNNETGYSAYMLVFGHEMSYPVDLILGEAEQQDVNYGKYTQELKHRLHTAYKKAREKMKITHHRQKANYDMKKNQINYQIGDKVWLSNEIKHFSNSPWIGPYTIQDIIGDKTYRIDPIYI